MVWHHNTFSVEDDARMIHAREVLELEWREIGPLLNRPWQSCHWRYTQRLRPLAAKPVETVARPRRLSFHETLGIKTQVVEVAVNDAFRSSDRRRMKITLAAV